MLIYTLNDTLYIVFLTSNGKRQNVFRKAGYVKVSSLEQPVSTDCRESLERLAFLGAKSSLVSALSMCIDFRERQTVPVD